MEDMNNFPVLATQSIYAAVVSLVIGFMLGYVVGRQHKNNGSTKALTQLQILSVAMFFGYLAVTAGLRQDVSEVIAIGILSLTGGEALGAFAQLYVRQRKGSQGNEKQASK